MNNEKNKFYAHIVFTLVVILYATKIIPQIAFYTICGLVIGYLGYLHFSSKKIEVVEQTKVIQSDEEE